MGCETVVLSTSASKEKLARELGASHFLVTSDPEVLKAQANTLDFIIDTGKQKESILRRSMGSNQLCHQ